VPTELPELEAQLARVSEGLGEAVDELRELSRGIHPAILSEGGLGPALKVLARRSPVPVELEVHQEGRLPAPVEVAAYYVIAEALTNTAKHTDASVVHVDVQARAGLLRLTVEDDGVGGATVAGLWAGRAERPRPGIGRDHHRPQSCRPGHQTADQARIRSRGRLRVRTRWPRACRGCSSPGLAYR
jgi:signal transduction histidine kinase